MKTLKRYTKCLGPYGAVLYFREKVLRSKKQVVVTPFGKAAPVHARLGTTDLKTFSQVFGKNEYDSFSFVTSPKWIVDGGGNIGFAALFFARKFPTAKIITIEPSAENFEVLKANVAHYPNVIPVHAALWNESGTIDLVDPGSGNWGFETGNDGQGHPVVETVDALTVSDVIAKFQLGEIDLLKLDIEGSEREVMADSNEWIGRVRALVVELHEHMRSGCRAAWESAITEFPDRWKSGENDCAAREGVCETFADR